MNKHDIANYIRANMTDDEVLEWGIKRDTPLPQDNGGVDRRITKPAKATVVKSGPAGDAIMAVFGEEGCAISDIERLVSDMPRSSIQRALARLKESGQLKVAGDRRFMRYAKTQEAAEAASLAARGRTA